MVATVSRGRGRRTINEINMVPFIDVMLVLLIIFMVTAPLIAPSVIDLPTIGKANTQTDKPIHVLYENKKITIKVNEKDKPLPTSLENLASNVQKIQNGNNKIPVIINADKSAKYADVVAIMDKLQASGLQRVGLAVQVTK